MFDVNKNIKLMWNLSYYLVHICIADKNEVQFLLKDGAIFAN